MLPVLFNKFFLNFALFLGLKATESELEKLKCPKCDFQAYFHQQFQDHIATHPEAIEKCKCCSHMCFSEEELLAHFRVSAIKLFLLTPVYYEHFSQGPCT